MKRSDTESIEHLRDAARRIAGEVGKVIVGQNRIVEDVMIGMLAGGHCLIIGVPGLAKTLLVNTIARVLDMSFSRIQFTPDLMPSDITGTQVIEEEPDSGRRNFRFIKGPIFANVVMADEINRTPPKTQAALLQAMQEYRVTAGGSTFEVPRPFFVLATQNPIEQEGTYPLPEAQLDRFMFCLNMDYPSFDEEIQIVKTTTSAYEGGVERVLNGEEIDALQKLIRRIPVAADVISYAVGLAAMSRPSDRSAPQCVRDWVAWGAGPRASQYLILAAKTRAALAGRYTPELDDVRQSAKIVLRHRVITNFNAEADGIKPDTVIERLVEHSRR